VPGSPQLGPALAERLSQLAREFQMVLVTGAVGVERVQPDSKELRYLDSAFAFDAYGGYVDRYDKVRLVPFGEFMPLSRLLGAVSEPIARGIAEHEVSAGPENRVLILPLADGRIVRVGIPICYELLFPDSVRRFGAAGAQVLLAITNDVHFGDTGGPHQFLVMAALRSAETGLWMARAANSGVSAVIDARGRIRERTPLFERTTLAADVALRAREARPTFYARHGDVFARLCWAGIALLLAWPWLRAWTREAVATE
jgi:apolipoprotein N-acyltransferase